MHCVSIEHKLGIHASPTAVLAYGDKGGAVGYLVGEENRGLEYMFIMMNLARFSVGLEGVGISERAYQRAVAYARDRVQGKAVGLDKGAKGATIIEHPDIRRMLMTMRAYTEATRAVAYVTAAALGQRVAQSGSGGARQAPGVRRLHDPDRQGLVDGDGAGGDVARRAGARRDGLHRGDRRRAALSAMRGSSRSTKARRASRPTT